MAEIETSARATLGRLSWRHHGYMLARIHSPLK